MMPADTPDQDTLLALMDDRAEPSVTIALTSSPSPRDHERIRIALRGAIDDVERRLTEQDLPHGTAAGVVDGLRDLLDDDEFWAAQSRSLVILASPTRTETFRLATPVRDITAVSDRFQVSQLLRAMTDEQRVFVLQLAEGLARLTEFGPDRRPVDHPLDLPGDHGSILTHAENDGRLDRRRAQGAKGDQVERERYSRVVQDEVARIVPGGAPLILVAAADLDTAYRAVNTHADLLDAGIDAHPGSLDDRDLAARADELLAEDRARETQAWKERFGTLRSQGLATSRLVEVAAAAAEGAIDELRFDVDAAPEGELDEFGRIDRDADATALVDEIAARALHMGGRVRGVRRRDLVDGSPVAATLRFPASVSR